MRDRCLAMPFLVSGVSNVSLTSSSRPSSLEGAAHFMELDPVLPGEPDVCPSLGLSVNRHHPKMVISVKPIEIPKYIQK
jgi:hypothetical protein